jgi:hypothetical protein
MGWSNDKLLRGDAMNSETRMTIFVCIGMVIAFAMFVYTVLMIGAHLPAGEPAPSDEHTWYVATYQLTSHADMNVSVQLVISAGDWTNYSGPVTVVPGETYNITVMWPDVQKAVVLVYVFDQSNYVWSIKWYIYEPDMVNSQVVR